MKLTYIFLKMSAIFLLAISFFNDLVNFVKTCRFQALKCLGARVGVRLLGTFWVENGAKWHIRRNVSLQYWIANYLLHVCVVVHY